MDNTGPGLIPFSVVESVMHKLTSSVFGELGPIKGVKDELDSIKGGIESIKAVLPDVEFTQFLELDTAHVRLWIARPKELWIQMLKDVLVAADDLFDEVATENLMRLKRDGGTGRKVRSFFFSSTNAISYRKRIAREIKRIAKKVNDTVERMSRLKMSQFNLQYEGEWQATISSFEKSDLIGREAEKMELVRLLTQPHGNENISLIAIVGAGGIGKTAVAKMVYAHEVIKESFGKRMWVNAYGDVRASVKKIIDQLLTSDERNDQESLDLEVLLNKLDDILNGKKYLLVLDGICIEWHETWTQLKNHLMCGAQGSKILVTTRSTVVTEVMKVNILFHLKSMSEEDSWSLLKESVLLCPIELEPVGRKIAMKCGGFPLAIKIVAETVYYKREKSEWINILEKDFWELVDSNAFMTALKLTFRELLPRLKQCFAYCSVYPKGWEIGRDELVQSWMAQGYLECNDDEQRMEDVGNELVKTLLNYSFFSDAKMDEYGSLVSFKMHGLIHDLASVVASNDYYHLNSERKVNRPMHMCFTSESDTIDLLRSFDASRLRTSIFLPRADDREFAQMTRALSVILRFKRLRILNLSHSSLKKLPDLIGRLKHLRYLDLSWCVKLASLPKSIGNLVNLQTLKFTGCETLEFSTEVVTKLINLRHLEIHRCKAFEDMNHMMPAGLGKLSSLQSLSRFHVVAADHHQKKKAGKLNELQNLNNLRGNLEISGLDRVRDVMRESQDVNLKGKKLLVSLDLEWGNQDEPGDSLQLLENLRPHECLKGLYVRWYPGERFSDWLSSIDHLSHIYLFGFHNCTILPPLEHLPHLRSLEIGSMKRLEVISFEASSLGNPAKFFPSLERLQISGCQNLEGWRHADRIWCDKSMIYHRPARRLSKLIINRCPNLDLLPGFPNVEELQLCGTNLFVLLRTLEEDVSSAPLSKLRSLKIEGKLRGIGYLPSGWKENLTSLEYLEIGDVENLDRWFEKEDSFPSLREIVIYDCDSQALPDKMCDLQSLEHIKILGCHKLASLPDRMTNLTNLKTLEIWDCPLLVERCQRETGADWPRISKIQSRILKLNERR